MRLAALLLVILPFAHAQFIPGRYIVELNQLPAAAELQVQTKPAAARLAAAAEARTRIRAAQRVLSAEIEQTGGTVRDSTETVANTLLVDASEATAAQIAQRPGVLKVRQVRLYKRLLDRAISIHKAMDVWSRVGQENAGRNMKIAIIDTGIDLQHAGFRDESVGIPEGYPKVNAQSDIEFTNNKVIVARSYAALFARVDPDPSARDRVGHGTALGMAAAGVPNSGALATISGIAPKAYLGNYKVFGTSGINDSATDAAILKAIEDAVNDGMDVINLSLGTLLAARPEDDILVQALQRAESMGVINVIAAGNDGPDLNTISSPATAEASIAVGASTNDRRFSTIVVADGQAYESVPGSSSANRPSVNGTLTSMTTLDPTGFACNPLPGGTLSGRIALILRGDCTFEQKLGNAQAAGAIAAVMYTDKERPDPVVMEAGAVGLPACMVSHQDGIALENRLTGGTIDATLHFQPQPFRADLLRLATFSSRGPSAGNSIKPDLVATGTSVYIATQRLDTRGDMFSSDGYITVQGTSFSTPLVAGAAALIKSLRPAFTPAEYRSFLINAARPFQSSAPLPLQQTGAGILDVGRALDATLAISPPTLSLGTGTANPQLTRKLTLRNLSEFPEVYEVSVAPATGAMPATTRNTVVLAPFSAEEMQIDLNQTSLAPGAHEGFVELRQTRTGAVARVPYWYAVKSSVPAGIVILHAASTARAGTEVKDAIFFRIIDAAGVPIESADPRVTVTSGGGTVTALQFHNGDVAEAYGLDVRLGLGVNVVRIEAGEIVKEITIQGR